VDLEILFFVFRKILKLIDTDKLGTLSADPVVPYAEHFAPMLLPDAYAIGVYLLTLSNLTRPDLVDDH
jgi:hypothetical protein